MVSFNNLKGIDGIDKLNECANYIDTIFADKNILDELKGLPWIKAAVPIYQKYQAEFDAIFDILGHKPESTVEIVSSVARLLSEATSEEIGTFFIATCGNLKSALFATANTKGGPQPAISNT